MNPLAVALARALATEPRTHAALAAAFDDALAAVEFAPEAQAVVLGVPSLAAVAWAEGRLADVDLVLSLGAENLMNEPKHIWFACLPNRCTYSLALEEARRLFMDGARGIIARTKNVVVGRHMVRFGCRPALLGEDGGNRLIGDKDVIRRWLGRLTPGEATPNEHE